MNILQYFSCEIAPGPLFMLRSYNLLETGSFTLHRYFFTDDRCTTPTHALVAHGNLYPQNIDFAVPGGRKFEYALKSVDFVPYSKNAIKNVALKLVNSTCFDPERRYFKFDLRKPIRLFQQNIRERSWNFFESPSNFDYIDPIDAYRDSPVDPDLEIKYPKPIDSKIDREFDCLWSLRITFLELKLMRMTHARKGHKVLRTGKVHFDDQKNAYVRPSSFGPALVDAYGVRMIFILFLRCFLFHFAHLVGVCFDLPECVLTFDWGSFIAKFYSFSETIMGRPKPGI